MLSFKHFRRELPFAKCAHLRNPWNDNKDVKICRDGQVNVFSFKVFYKLEVNYLLSESGS